MLSTVSTLRRLFRNAFLLTNRVRVTTVLLNNLRGAAHGTGMRTYPIRIDDGAVHDNAHPNDDPKSTIGDRQPTAPSLPLATIPRQWPSSSAWNDKCHLSWDIHKD